MIAEINFDGLIGPTHNYAGLSLGNIASTANRGAVSHPRDAALQGLGKMRAALALGLAQGLLLPHPRPDREWLALLGTTIAEASPGLRADAMSASAMWAANAATVSPAPDTRDGRCHLTVANLATMVHRSHEWPATLKQLRLAFADGAHFAVHPPIPPVFGDEGAANHMRLAAGHDAPGIEIFVYGMSGGPFPARQHEQASRAIARLHGLDPARTILAAQSEEAIAAGAFHNDVVAVANAQVLLAHERAFARRRELHAAIRELLPAAEIIEVPAEAVSLEEAVGSYLFNAQLVTLPEGGMALILPEEARESDPVWRWLQDLVAGGGPISRLEVVDVRQSMSNGGGPACLRLRVVCDPARVDPRFLADEAKLDRLSELVERHWPERIAPADLAEPALWEAAEQARKRINAALNLSELD
ncbi:MAG: N-succinylarginine dihydrolase [Sphingomonadaceae bacterium]